jgi:hypothetical protein
MSAVRVLRTGAVAVLTILGGCGGSGGSGATTYTISGTVLGLKSGEAVVITDGAGNLSENSNGTFTFPGVYDGTIYAVTVKTNPTGQSCGVLAGTGTIDAANVSGIDVYCTDNVSTSALDGTYEIAAFNINSDTDQLYTSVPFNGNGTQGASTVITNQAGTTFTTSTDPGGPYNVTTADALPVLTVGNSAGGIAGADGDEFYWVADDLSGGAPPELVLGVNPLQTATLNSLAGTWITVGLTQAPTPYDSEGSIAIGADGSFSGSESTLDVTGAANTQTVSGGPGSYTVTNYIVSTGADSGYISANGKFLVLAAVTQQAGTAYPNVTAGVQPGSGMTAASLSVIRSRFISMAPEISLARRLKTTTGRTAPQV